MRRPVLGEIVTVFEEEVKIEGGRMRKLLGANRRVLQQGEIHELFITNEKDVKPGGNIKSHSLLGQFEVTKGGMIKIGDKVKVANNEIGNLAGYEACKVLRAPQSDLGHIFASSDRRGTGTDLNLNLGDEVIFEPSGT